MDGDAWLFLIGDAICLVNSDKERNFRLLNKPKIFPGSYIYSGAHQMVRRTSLACRIRMASSEDSFYDFGILSLEGRLIEYVHTHEKKI